MGIDVAFFVYFAGLGLVPGGIIIIRLVSHIQFLIKAADLSDYMPLLPPHLLHGKASIIISRLVSHIQLSDQRCGYVGWGDCFGGFWAGCPPLWLGQLRPLYHDPPCRLYCICRSSMRGRAIPTLSPSRLGSERFN